MLRKQKIQRQQQYKGNKATKGKATKGKVSPQAAILFAKMAGKNNEALDKNQSQQWGGTGTSAQEAIIINSQSHIANKKQGSHHWLQEQG